MFHTFSYKDGQMVIAVKVWSDFASNIPLIRSFSLGDNIPPQFPLFSGEPIRYHFLFYLLVGLLEKIGLPIDFALNTPSALSFALLIMVIYFMANILFKSKIIGLLSVIFFLLNGSFSFLEFFKSHPLSVNIIKEIITNSEYPSFAPYGSGIVSAFWNLNIYTNQRHLALPLAVFLLVVLWIIRQEQKQEKIRLFLMPIVWGVCLGILLYAHTSIFIMAVTALGLLFLMLPRERLPIFIIGLTGFMISLPRILFLKETATFTPQIKLGYLIADKLTLPNFLEYWFLNLGLFLILLPLGFLLSSKLAKKVLIAFISLFIIGNVIQFSPEMAGNHKFFNVFLIVGNMFVAFAVIKLWSFSFFTKMFVPIIIFFLILSGIIDLFPIKNDRFMIINDYPKNPDVAWIVDHTKKDSIFLNYSYLYDPASLAGRKIFLGWPYFAWSLGHNTDLRAQELKTILETNDLAIACQILNKHHLDYIEIQKNRTDNPDYPKVSNLFLTELPFIYTNPITNFSIIEVKSICL